MQAKVLSDAPPRLGKLTQISGNPADDPLVAALSSTNILVNGPKGPPPTPCCYTAGCKGTVANHALDGQNRIDFSFCSACGGVEQCNYAEFFGVYPPFIAEWLEKWLLPDNFGNKECTAFDCLKAVHRGEADNCGSGRPLPPTVPKPLPLNPAGAVQFGFLPAGSSSSAAPNMSMNMKHALTKNIPFPKNINNNTLNGNSKPKPKAQGNSLAFLPGPGPDVAAHLDLTAADWRHFETRAETIFDHVILVS